MEEDLYSGYDDTSNPLADGSGPTPAPPASSAGRRNTAQRLGTAQRMGTAARGGTAVGRGPPGTGFGPPRTALRSGTGNVIDENTRPMTAVKAAGYSGGKKPGSRGGSGGMHRPQGPSEAELCKQLEAQIHKLMEDAAMLIQDGSIIDAHKRAQEAQSKAQELQQKHEANNWQDNAQIDLQFAVQVCLANCCQAAGLDQEALSILHAIVRSGEFHMAWRMRVNIGHVHFKRKQWAEAVKHYRMTLDQIPNERQGHGAGPYTTLQCRLLCNIGVAFLHQGLYADARDNFEAVLRLRPSATSAFNRLLCSYMIMTSVEQAEALKQGFRDLLKTPRGATPRSRPATAASAPASQAGGEGGAVFERCVVAAAKLVAPRINPQSADAGFLWCVDELTKAKLPRLVDAVHLAQAAHCLPGDVDKAVAIFKQFERASSVSRTKAASNLSFLYLLEGKLDEAERYAVQAKEADEYHVQALVNLGNCKFERAASAVDEASREDVLAEARTLYDAAARTEPDCVEAIYNIGLAAKAGAQYDVALEQFVLLNGLVPNQVEVLYQIADVYLLKGDRKRAAKMLQLTHDHVGAEPGLLARLAALHAEGGARDESLALYLQAYEQLPSLDVLALLCAQYVNDERYELAAQHFEAAARMQPSEPKWRLMVASCWHRAGSTERAFELYEQVHEAFPDNAEALRSLVQLAVTLHAPEKRASFEQRLQKVERAAALRAEVPMATGGGTTAGSAGATARRGSKGVAAPVPGSGYGFGGGYQLEQGLGGGMDLLPDVEAYQPPAGGEQMLVPATGGGGKDVWDEQLGTDLLPGLD